MNYDEYICRTNVDKDVVRHIKEGDIFLSTIQQNVLLHCEQIVILLAALHKQILAVDEIVGSYGAIESC